MQIQKKFSRISDEQKSLLIAIDGKSASGKTTFASYLQKNLPCELLHMDDFFLPIEKREENWKEIPGGNIDFDRFLEEVMLPIQKGVTCTVRPFDCKSQSMKEGRVLGNKKIILIEGAYSCHPKLWDYYDLHIFTDIETKQQIERIRQRNGEAGAVRFQEQWIPLEEAYFRAYEIKEKCELHF